MQQLYHYNLFKRNCVTEIFSTIDKANINDKYIEEIEQLAHNNLIAFIPFGSFHSLSSNYSKQTLPSFRHQQLTKMYQQENNLLVYLREFNTLSARDYKFNDLDSAFLFLQMTTYGVAHYLVHSIYSLLQRKRQLNHTFKINLKNGRLLLPINSGGINEPISK